MTAPQNNAMSPGLTRALIVAVLGVVGGIALVLVVSSLAGSGSIETNLGTDTFEAGEIGRISEEIADRGPTLYQDPLGRGRDIYLQHLGEGPGVGWLAFAVRPEGAPRECFIQWQVEAEIFTDSCTGEEYPDHGGELVHYDVQVIDGLLFVNLREPLAGNPATD